MTGNRWPSGTYWWQPLLSRAIRWYEPGYSRVLLSDLAEPARRALVAEIIDQALQALVADREVLERYWASGLPEETVAHLLRDRTGRLVGHAVYKYHQVELDGRPIRVAKGGLAVLPGVSGTHFGVIVGLHEFTLYRLSALRHLQPTDDAWLFSTVLHPTAYKMIATTHSRMHPHYAHPTPPAVVDAIHQLADYFGVDRSPAADSPLVYQEPIATRRPVDPERARRDQHPATQFYLSLCPDYTSGQCIAMLMPVDTRFVATFAAVHLLRRWRGKLGSRARAHSGEVRA